MWNATIKKLRLAVGIPLKRWSVYISEVTVQANTNVEKARATKNKKTCFNTRPAEMTYADKVLLNTAMSASHKQNNHITNGTQEASKRMAAKSRGILKDDQKL